MSKTAEEAAELVTAAKTKYPKPKAATMNTDDTCNDYCVGGALARCTTSTLMKLRGKLLGFPTGKYRFPAPFTLAEVLRNCNPALEYGPSYNYANSIINANDKERFDDAWQYVLDALQYPNVPLAKKEECDAPVTSKEADPYITQAVS